MCVCQREEQIVFVASPQHPLASKQNITLVKFLSYPLVATEGSGFVYSRLSALSAAEHLVPNNTLAQTILNSIAFHFGEKYKVLKQITGCHFKRVVMLGGASRSNSFVKLCSSYIDVPIIVGAHEASGFGNLMAQQSAFIH